MKILILSSVLFLTGCASQCTKACLFGIGPGNSAFDKVAKFHDDTDPCQYSGKKQNYVLPEFCGSSKPYKRITDVNGHTKLLIK
jgi:hypothetical protein